MIPGRLVRVAAASHVGRVRSENQDRVVCGGWTVADDVWPVAREVTIEQAGSGFAVAVVDGLGGHAGGALAASMVASILAQRLHEVTDEGAAQKALLEAHTAVMELAREARRYAEMGATVACLVARSEGLLVFNVGDCRVYRLTGDYLGQLSVDDRTKPDAHGHSFVTQCVGGGRAPATDIHYLEVAGTPGSRFLLCSDGLHDYVEESELRAALQLSPDAAVSRLLEAALARGGPDNVSVSVLEVLGADDTGPPAGSHAGPTPR